ARRDIKAKRDALSRAFAIISELQSTLDLDKGGDIAERLDALYGYANFRLLDASAQNDVKPIDEVRRVIETLRDGWSTIAAARPAPPLPGREPM
ncbi:MAG: flagellar export chaperone FliS, partial [Vicinamibacterales bacterium]